MCDINLSVFNSSAGLSLFFSLSCTVSPISLLFCEYGFLNCLYGLGLFSYLFRLTSTNLSIHAVNSAWDLLVCGCKSLWVTVCYLCFMFYSGDHPVLARSLCFSYFSKLFGRTGPVSVRCLLHSGNYPVSARSRCFLCFSKLYWPGFCAIFTSLMVTSDDIVAACPFSVCPSIA